MGSRGYKPLPLPQLILEDELSTSGDSGSSSLDVAATPSTALRVNNNILNSWDGFLGVVAKLVAGGVAALQWLDLSFNDLKTIDVVSSGIVCYKYYPNLYTIFLSATYTHYTVW